MKRVHDSEVIESMKMFVSSICILDSVSIFFDVVIWIFLYFISDHGSDHRFAIQFRWLNIEIAGSNFVFVLGSLSKFGANEPTIVEAAHNNVLNE